MEKVLSTLGKKILGLSIIFNSLVCISSAVNILVSFYDARPFWQPYAPFLLNGSFFWAVVIAAIINIMPARRIGNAKWRRILFHHHTYGIAVSFSSIFWIIFFTPHAFQMITTFPYKAETITAQHLFYYMALCFVYGGFALFVDDVHDISSRTRQLFEGVISKFVTSGWWIRGIHLLSGILSLYVSVSVVIWFIKNYGWIRSWHLWILSHLTLTVNLICTSVYTIYVAKRKRYE